MKANRKGVKRLLSVLLCCVLLLLPLGMTAGAVQEEGPEYREDLSRSIYIEDVKYDFVRSGTDRAGKLTFSAKGVSGVTNIKLWVEIRRCPIGGGSGDWYVYANEKTDSNLESSGIPLDYRYTISGLPDGYYEATYTVRAYKTLLYQTYNYTTPMISIY